MLHSNGIIHQEINHSSWLLCVLKFSVGETAIMLYIGTVQNKYLQSVSIGDKHRNMSRWVESNARITKYCGNWCLVGWCDITSFPRLITIDNWSRSDSVLSVWRNRRHREVVWILNNMWYDMRAILMLRCWADGNNGDGVLLTACC